MSCNLSKMSSYDVGRVVHDNNNGVYTVQLVNPPSSCPDTTFMSKRAQVLVAKGVNPQLSYDIGKNTPIIVVPRQEYVEEVGGSSFFGLGLALVLTSLAFTGIFLYLRRKQKEQEYQYIRSNGGYSARTGLVTPSGNHDGSHLAGNNVSDQPTGGGATIINNNSGGNNGLVEGMLIGSILSNNHSERVVERETIIEREAPSSSYSSDSDSSFNSDSGSSDYSSDNDSSFSSDSSSDFSSDSGSSFDSGSGGSFDS